ncbi:MAG: FHA domain-containing protein, partial [Planctomycetes bacterium]|nr:FHA domain-containing protein [Planctomycetota bacterium]
MADVDATQKEPAAPRLIVEVLTSSLAGRRFAFTSRDLRAGVMIGRAPDCKVRFDGSRDLKVSGHHALLEERKEGIFLRDQGSSNGLYVNKHRATAEGTRVYDTYEISLGQEGALLKLVIPGEPPPPVSKFPSSLNPPRQPQYEDDPESLAVMVNEVGAKVGAGEKTKHMIKEVAEKLEARAARRRANLVTLVGALFMLLVAAAAIGVWYYQHNEEKHAAEKAQDSAKLDESERKRQEAESRRAEAEKQRQKDLDELRKKLDTLEGSMAEQVATLKLEQDKRLDQLKRDVDEQTAARVKEISEAQLKELKLATSEQIEQLKELYKPPSEAVFRELAETCNASVFLVYVQYPLLDENGKAVGIEGGTGTGWLART